MYAHHKICNREDIVKELDKLSDANIRKEQQYLCLLLQPIIKYFDEQHIYEYPNYIVSLRSHGMKSSLSLQKLILKFKHTIMEKEVDMEKKDFLSLLKKRSLEKVNFTIKNLILFRFLKEYGLIFLNFLNKYLDKIGLEKDNKNEIISETENFLQLKHESENKINISESISDAMKSNLNIFPVFENAYEMTEFQSQDSFNNNDFVDFETTYHFHYDDGDGFFF